MSAVAGPKAGATSAWVDGRASGDSAEAHGETPSRVIRCEIRWSVSREAIAASFAGSAGERPIELAPRGADPIVEWNVTGDGASVSLVDGSSRLPIFETTGEDIGGDAARVEMTTIDSLVHLRVSRRGVCLLAAVLRESGSRPVLYACTSVLAELGVGGGRYEVLDGRVVSE